MRFRTVSHHFQEAFISLRRNGLMSLASIGTVAVTLLILGSAVLLVMNANYAVGSAENQLQITVLVDDQADQAAVQDLEVAINQIPHVQDNKFVSKADGLNELKDAFSEDRKALEFGSNPLPDTFRVKVDKLTNVSQVAQTIKALDGVTDVRVPSDVVKKLQALMKWVRGAGSVVMVLLGLAAIFLISTTIRLTVFSRRREINIMKFLGATDWFIRWPFVLEGLVLGLIGSLLAVTILYFSYMSLLNTVKVSIPFLPLKADLAFLISLMESLVGVGVVIGGIGSIVSVRKFLRV